MAEARILYLATAAGLVQLANPGKSDRWREIGRALPGQELHAVVTSASDPLLAYAASAQGVSRTNNGGASWDLIQPTPSRALAFDRDGVLYVGTERGVVLASSDGETWREEDAFQAPVVQIMALDDNTLLSVGGDGSVCQRTVAGWQPRELHVPSIRGIAASHRSTHELFVVNKQSLVTAKGSSRIDDVPTGALVVLSGSPEVLLLGTHSSLLRSDDAGDTLVPVEGPQQVTVLVSPPRFVDQAFAGTAAGELWYSADRGRSWIQVRSGDPPLRAIAFARAL